MPLYLASASPRRRELLMQIGVEFLVVPSHATETLFPSSEDTVRENSRRKAMGAVLPDASCVVLGADTVVELDGRILGKPKDRRDAWTMLQALSGRTHRVFTGVTLYRPLDGRMETECCRTDVTFGDIPGTELKCYVDTGECMDKAGAYALQGGAGAFVTRLDGSMSNVIGLPLHLVRTLLCHFGLWETLTQKDNV